MTFIMVTISATYEGELRCSARHEPSGSLLCTDAPLDNQGKGEAFSPTDLCATSLGTCMTTIMGIRARQLGIDISGARFEVKKIMSTDTPRRIVGLPIEFWIPGRHSDEVKSALRNAAETCPVNYSIHPDIERPITIHWIGED